MKGGAAWGRLLFLAAWLPGAAAFIWSIDNEYPAGQYKYTFSELYMFAAADTAVKGNAFIHLDLRIDVAAVATQNVTLHAVVFHVPGSVAGDPVDTQQLNGMLQDLASETELCAPHLAPIPRASHVRAGKFETHPHTLDGLGVAGAADADAPDPRFQFVGSVNMMYKVKVSGLHSVIVEVCNGDKAGVLDAATRVTGTIAFRNPYGYLSGIYYGYYPFEGCRAAVFFCFALFYAAALVRNWAHAMGIHLAIFAMVLLCLAESTTWFGAYGTLNDTGAPYCCPFPSPVVAAMVLECARRAGERALLLVLALGHGVATPSLAPAEFVKVLSLSLLYLAAALAVGVRDVVEVNDLHRTSAHAVWWDLPVLLLDLGLLVWIYAALLNTMANLREGGQWAKLELYSNLALVMGAFVGLVSATTLVLVLARSGAFKWPWELYWVQTVLWEVLNLGVMVAVAVLWAPSARAKLLATSSQLGGHDDEEDGDEGPSLQFGVEPGSSDDDDGDGEYDVDEGQGGSISRFQLMLQERQGGGEVELQGLHGGNGLSDGFEDEEDYSSLPTAAG